MTDINKLMESLTLVSEEKQQILNREIEIKDQLLEAMKQQKISALENSRIKVKCVPSSSRNRVDTDLLKKQFSDAAARCMKSTLVKSFVRVTVLNA